MITIIVPCYNEQEVLDTTFSRLKSALHKAGEPIEYLFVNDGSTDKTLPMLKTLCQSEQHMRVISFSRNFGHQAAVTAGINHARGQAAVIIDADLQDPPECIPDMIRLWKEGAGQIIYGRRVHRKGETAFKKTTAKQFYRILDRLSDTPIPHDTGDFRLIDRKVIDAFNTLQEKNKFIRGLIPWLGFTAVPLDYTREARVAGETKYPLRKMIKLALDGLLSLSRKPLQFATSVGMLTIIVSLLLIAYVLVSFFLPSIPSAPGWASTVLIIVFFNGVQLLSLGIIGAYLGRIFDEVKQRPDYVIDQIIQGEPAEDP